MASKFLLLFKPFQRFIFEVKKPARKPTFKRKIAWTFGILAIYLVMLNIPIVGIPAGDDNKDPFCKKRLPDDQKWALDHFYKKLLRLESLMNTASGKTEAKRRTKILKSFLSDLKKEL